jgi:STAG domain
MATISEDDEKRIRETSEMIKNLTEDLQQFQVSGVTAEVLEKVLETVEYLTGMSLSQNRELRHTATASGLSLSTGIHYSSFT